MRTGDSPYNLVVVLRFLTSSYLFTICASAPTTGSLPTRDNNPLGIDWDPAPPPDQGPPASAGALRDPAYLPAQIGGIVGSYALSLVLVALLLLALSKKRREHIEAAEAPEEDKANLLAFNPFPAPFQLQSEEEYNAALLQAEREGLGLSIPYQFYPQADDSPLSPAKSHHSVWTAPSPTSTVLAPGIDLSVDQRVVQIDRAMAQSQLEDMYKYVMEQEEAKAEGREYQGPALPAPAVAARQSAATTTAPNSLRKSKPAGLDLSKQEKSQSRSNSIFSFLKSPRKSKGPQGMSISSPIITPMSGTFPGHMQEMGPMSPRNYGVLPPPPAPLHSDLPFRRPSANTLPTPDMSPVSAGGGIDGRIDAAMARPPTRESRAAAREAREREARETREDKGSSYTRDVSATTNGGSDEDPVSAVSERSDRSLRSDRSSGFVGLPTSPKPGVNRFPSLDSLPSSPKPGSTFSRANKPTAIRTGGALPLRAYEPSIVSPSAATHTTKQTVFTRAEGPLSPGMQTGMRTPWTGAPMPYTPYQPFSPVVPITPSLVTRADRKRMKKFEPRTPTVEMVKSDDDIW
ncbi:hypothetical protein QBC47DRAFT_380936 [Echria macrotheca]|uniref:Uncharacterized protein n=1 Tax=Echria macrotheca TaxID=438768 RepID=A0AAJ0BEK3_9PEZI|nr:hypothetical protein QBC47DRAFT_380936 [Echria macrotheca]